MRTGLAWVDAREEFDRARRQASRAKLAGWLRGRSSRRNRLLVLGEATIITGAGGAVSSRSAGTRACHDELASQALVPIDRIVGTVEPIRCFDRKFRPTSELPRTRFERIAAEARSGRGMDPVDLYRCGNDYYVLDGHHRIAVARALAERAIFANVTEVHLSQPSMQPR
jgi:hypothetical protein